MDIHTKLRSRFDELNSEHGLLLLFIVASTYMFFRARDWSFNTKVFPQSMAALVIIGSLLILFQDYLPGPLQTLVVETGGAFGDTEELEEEIEEESEDETDTEEVSMPDYGRPLNPVLMTAIFITAYAVLGYYFSLFIMSPIFVAVYLVWFRQPWWVVAILSALALALAYAFATIIIVPVDRGVLVGDLLMIGGVI